MNDYKVLEISGSGELSAVITAIDEKDARRLFREKYKASGQREITVTLIRENTPATKAQEREAVERIRAIVATLGPRSYVGTALEGCLEDAEVNIENDFGDSMKARWQSAERRVAQSAGEIVAVKEELGKVRNALRDAESNVDYLARKVISDDDLTEIERMVEGYISRLRDMVKAADATILEYAEHPETTTFCDAVRERKNLAKDIEHYQALGLRLAATRGK